MITRSVFAIACLCAVTAYAQDTQKVKFAPTGIELPRRIGPVETDGEMHSFGDPALGVAYQYDGDGISLTVYVYDLGMPDIPDGADTIATCEEFENVKAGLLTSGYTHFTTKQERLVKLAPPAEVPLAREASFEFEFKGHPVVSYLWLTGAARNFVKVRFSIDAGMRDEVIDARRAILDALGEAVRPHLVPVDPNASKPGAALNFGMNDGSDDAVAADMLYLATLAALLDKSPQLGPVCGGQFVPDFGTDVDAYRTVAVISNQGGDEKSRIGKHLALIDSAGFLEEFVWTDLHRDEWGKTIPQGLALADFKKWRKKNLKGFRLHPLGSVVVNHPRPLPLEPPDKP